MKSNPRVLFVLYQGGRESDGGALSLFHVISGIPQDQCVIISFGGSKRNERWRLNGVRVYELRHWRQQAGIFQKAKTLLVSSLAILAIVRRERPEVVHLNDIKSAEQAFLLAFLRRPRRILNVRDVKEKGGYGLKWKLIVLCVDHVLVLSREMGEKLARDLPLALDGRERCEARRRRNSLTLAVQGRNTPVSYIYSAVPWVGQSASVESRHLDVSGACEDFGQCVLYVGGFFPKKGQLEFLRWGADSILHNTDAHICFLGDFQPESDAYSRYCQLEAAQLAEPERVRFIGHVENVLAWYRSASVTVLASEREGLARAMIESLASGVPVVTFDVTSAEEVVGGTGAGTVVPKGEYLALGRAVGDILSSESRRSIMRERGLETAKRLFDPDTVRGEYLRLYREVAFR